MAHQIHWQKSSFSGGGDGAECLELGAAIDGTLTFRESDAPMKTVTPTPPLIADLIRHLKEPR